MRLKQKPFWNRWQIIGFSFFPPSFPHSIHLGLCLLNSIHCQDSICKWNLTAGEQYKCNNITQLLFNFEGSILSNSAYNGRFKLNYPLLLPKFTIKLSIKAGRKFSSRLGVHQACFRCRLRERKPEAAFS